MRTSIRTLVLAAGLMAPAAALAQPAATDLGTLTDGVAVTTGAFNVAANQVVWFKFTLTQNARYQDLRFLDLLTLTSADTEISLWSPTGNFIANDDDDGPGLASQLTFGTGDGSIPTGTTLNSSNGRDGDITLGAGTYYVGVSYFNVVWGTTNWTVTTPGNTALTGANMSIKTGPTPTVTDPAGTIDLGTAVYGTPISNTAGALSSSARVQWYKVILPEGLAAGGSYVDMDTEGTALAPSNTTRLTVFTAAGAQATNSIGNMTDLTDGSASLSQLTFGATAPTRPPVLTSATYDGRDGAIRAGKYYLNVMGTGSTPTNTSSTLSVNFGLTSTSTNYGPVKLNISAGLPPTNPSGVGTSSPVFGQVGDTTTLRVTVTPGQNPTSSGVGVTVDASSINAGTVTLLNDGVPPDAAIDNIWTANAVVGLGTTLGAKTLPFTITDSYPRTATGNISYTVVAPPPACPSGGVDTMSGAGFNSDGLVGDVANGVGTFAPVVSNLIGSLKINGRYIPNNAFTSEARIRVTAPNGVQYVVQPFTVSGPAGVPVDMVEQTIPVLCPVAANAGTWELRTFESLNDAGVDGVWQTVCVALVEAGPANPTVWSGDFCVADAGQLPGTAQVPVGTGALNSIKGTYGSTTDVDMYEINICDTALFSANTNDGSGIDTQMFLFDATGKGMLFNDDTLTTGGSYSTINNSGGQITTPGKYYLAVDRYNIDPQDSANALLWLNSPFTGIRVPDGAGAANPVSSWTGTGTSGGAYTIALTGVCYPIRACNIADITEIGGTAEAPGNPDGQLTVDDIILFINLFSDGTGCPGATPCSRADVTGIGGAGAPPDGQLTVDDVIEFFNAFSDGCPA